MNIQKLLGYETTENQNTFLVSADNTIKVLFGNVINKKKSNRLYDNGCLFKDNELKFNSLYDPTEFIFKSAIYANTDITDTTYDFQNIFNYQLSSNSLTSDFIQVNNFIYLLNRDAEYGKLLLNKDIWYELSANNGYYRLPVPKLSTVTFDKNKIKNLISNDIDINENTLSDCIKTVSTNIKYDQIFEIPGYIQNDYDSGTLAANVFKCKNQYDSLYNMQANVTRTYTSIDHCNNQIYLKYNEKNSNIANNKYEKIEVIDSLNRYEYLNTHKTNMYDVDIVCEQLFNDINISNSIANGFDDNLKHTIVDNIKFEMSNCVKEICKQLTPVDTQLININILENETDL